MKWRRGIFNLIELMRSWLQETIEERHAIHIGLLAHLS